MSFGRRLQKALVVFEGMGAGSYRPPKDPRELMADFYSLQLIDAGGERSVPSHRGSQLEFEVDSVKRTLIPYLRGHLLDIAGYSICCELRHLFDCCRPVKASRDIVALATSLLVQQYNVPEPFVDQLEELAEFDERPQSDSLDIGLKVICAKAGADLFYMPKVLSWYDSYGGQPWALACKTWLQLYAAKNLTEQTIYCDKLYSCEHNSGSLLDKNPGYKGSWVHFLLDLKYQANDPEQLLKYASSYMRKLGMLMLKEKHGRGWDTAKHGPASRSDRLSYDYTKDLAIEIRKKLSPHFHRIDTREFKDAIVMSALYTPDPNGYVPESSLLMISRIRVEPGKISVSGLTKVAWDAQDDPIVDATSDDAVEQTVRLVLKHLA